MQPLSKAGIFREYSRRFVDSSCSCARIRLSQLEKCSSRTITEFKQRWAWSVIGRDTLAQVIFELFCKFRPILAFSSKNK